MRDYIDVQLQKNGHAIFSLQEDVRRSQDKSRIDISGSYDFKRATNQHIQQTSTDDFRTRALKKTLAQDIQMTMLAQKLQCKPIEGHDIPLSELQRQTINDI